MDACARALMRELGDQVRLDPESLQRCAWDYGRMVQRTPAVVASVRSREELQAALRIGREHALPIVTRGSGHCMSGQGLAEGALVIDMKGLCDVQIDAERRSGWLSGGATWHRVINAPFHAWPHASRADHDRRHHRGRNAQRRRCGWRVVSHWRASRSSARVGTSQPSTGRSRAAPKLKTKSCSRSAR